MFELYNLVLTMQHDGPVSKSFQKRIGLLGSDVYPGHIYVEWDAR